MSCCHWKVTTASMSSTAVAVRVWPSCAVPLTETERVGLMSTPARVAVLVALLLLPSVSVEVATMPVTDGSKRDDPKSSGRSSLLTELGAAHVASGAVLVGPVVSAAVTLKLTPAGLDTVKAKLELCPETLGAGLNFNVISCWTVKG